MNTEFIKGVIVPIITTIDEDEKIDEAKMRAQVDYVIDGGLQGILAFGSNGEFYQIEEDEMERGFQIIVDQAAGRVPVYFGIGAINTKKCVRLAMDVASFPVAAKDMAAMRGRDVGSPYLPNLSTPEGVSYDKMKKEMEKAGLI